MIGQLLDLPRREARARAKELLAWFDLTDAADRPARTYSGGMRRRLDLAASLVGRPAVVFLDEPTTGLDPAKREDMWGVVRSLVDDGSTVLLTTQYLEEADALADEITVIDHGRVIAHDTPDGLKRIVGGQTLTVRPADPTRIDEVRAIVGDVARRHAGLAGTRRRQRPRRRRRGARRRGPPRSTTPASRVTELSLHLPEPRRGLLHPHRPRRRAADGMTARQPTGASARMSTADRRPPRRRGRRDGPPAPSALLRHSLVLARRSLIKTLRDARGARSTSRCSRSSSCCCSPTSSAARSPAARSTTTCSSCCRASSPRRSRIGGIAIGVNLNTDIDKGVFDRFRSLPIARSAPLVGAVLADIVRYVIVCVVIARLRLRARLPRRDERARGAAPAACWPSRSRCASAGSSVFVGMIARTPGAVQGIMMLLLSCR